jgi:hypothetical protein
VHDFGGLSASIDQPLLLKEGDKFFVLLTNALLLLFASIMSRQDRATILPHHRYQYNV